MDRNIHVLENMLTEEQCTAFREMYEQHAGNTTNYDYNRTPVVHYENLRGREEQRKLMLQVIELGVFTVQRLFERPQERAEAAFLARISRGHVHIPHIDNAKPDGTPNHTPQRTYSSLFYLNSDFQGGEIRFPNHHVSIKPKAGMFIAFPSSPPYLHYVAAVESGFRYSLPVWYSDRPQNAMRLL